MVIKTICVLIFLLNSWVLPTVFIVKCGVVLKNSRGSPISFKHVSLWCLSFDSHQITHQSNIGVQSGNVTIYNLPSVLHHLIISHLKYTTHFPSTKLSRVNRLHTMTTTLVIQHMICHIIEVFDVA